MKSYLNRSHELLKYEHELHRLNSNPAYSAEVLKLTSSLFSFLRSEVEVGSEVKSFVDCVDLGIYWRLRQIVADLEALVAKLNRRDFLLSSPTASPAKGTRPGSTRF